VTLLAGVLDGDGEAVLLRAIIEADVADNVPVDSGTIAITGARLHDKRSRQLLVEIAEDLTSASLASPDPDGPPPTALVVGDLPLGGRNAVRRRLWAHGVRLENTLDGPYRRYEEVRRQVLAFKGDLLLLSVPGCRDVIGQLVAVASPKSKRLLLLGEGELDYLLLEVDERLDDHRVDLPVGAAEPPDEDETWSSVTARVKCLQGDHFAVTKRCLATLPACPYPDPSRMLDQVEGLVRIARMWATKRGGVGNRLEDWAHGHEGLEIALHDKGLVRRRLHLFDFAGRTYNREPHVKVDDAKPFAECGRIYFALDRDHWRIIVDHIGLHPY
jgi:hypothetical protein